jgi:hypothetical protein
MRSRHLLPLVAAITFGAALGCARKEPLLIGETLREDDGSPPPVPGWVTPPPAAKGGGPNTHDPDDLDLGEPGECPEGFDDEDDTPVSPAHPPHLKKPGVEDNI